MIAHRLELLALLRCKQHIHIYQVLSTRRHSVKRTVAPKHRNVSAMMGLCCRWMSEACRHRWLRGPKAVIIFIS